MQEEIILLRQCRTCLENKPMDAYRPHRWSCKKCSTKKQNQVAKEKNYFATKYQEQKEERIKYQDNYYYELGGRDKRQLRNKLKKEAKINSVVEEIV
jgi:hypothetical protein